MTMRIRIANKSTTAKCTINMRDGDFVAQTYGAADVDPHGVDVGPERSGHGGCWPRR